jgi:sulfur carrier protein
VIVLNGKESDLPAGATVALVVERLNLPRDARGVAIAVDGEVIPRADWSTFSLGEDARVEVLGAMQGG